MIAVACALLLFYATYRAYRAVAAELSLASMVPDASPSDRTCALCRCLAPLTMVVLHDATALVCLPCQSVLAHTRAVA